MAAGAGEGVEGIEVDEVGDLLDYPEKGQS